MVKIKGYIDKAECVRRGFVRKNGRIYKMSILEKYAAKGWLEMGNEKYSAADRVKAAERLQRDYEMSHFLSFGTSAVRERVDSCGKNASDIDLICKARERYFEAVKQVPEEFWPVIEQVCLENRDICLSKEDGGKRKAEISYAIKRDLCRGLDRLIKYYWPALI